MSNEGAESKETDENTEAAAKPTITIAEKKSDSAEKKTTITIAEREGQEQA